MRYCLNPKNPHKNVGLSPSSEQDTPAGEERPRQLTCSWCKYLLADAVLDDCRVVRWLGSGTFGDVYEAEQLPPLRRRVALKVMSNEHATNGNAPELFEREVRAIAALDHPNIMPVLRVGVIDDGPPYLVMKYAAHGSLQAYCAVPTSVSFSPLAHGAETPPTQHVPGEHQNTAEESSLAAQDTVAMIEHSENLKDAAPSSAQPEILLSNTVDDAVSKKEQTPPEEQSNTRMLTPQQLLPYLEGAANGLQYAHDHGIIHLDVKPANLLLDADDRLLLADFGVSTLLEGYTHASLRGYVGTPLYTAPEQWLEQPRVASDQYALAVTCYQLLTGRPPFTGTLYSIMHGHIKQSPPSLRELQSCIPAEVEVVILRALAKEPTERYKDVRTFAQAYRTALEQSASAQTDMQSDYATIHLEIISSEHGAVPPTAEQEKKATSDLAELQTYNLVPRPAPTDRKQDEHQENQEHQEAALHSELRTTPKDAKRVLPATITTADRELLHTKIHTPRRRNSLSKVAILLVLALLFSLGGTFGLLRALDPCLVGICPSMVLSTHAISLINDDTQNVFIRNTGTADMPWKATLQNNVSWLRLSQQSGLLHPGQTATLVISSNASGQDAVTHTDEVLVASSGISTQSILVRMDIKTGIDAVNVQKNGADFTLSQGQLQPSTQHITVSNKSQQTLAWSTTYSENTWLVVTPDHGILKSGGTATLAVTVNAQAALTPNIYTATITLTGKLDNMSKPQLLNTFDIRLSVTNAPPTTPVTPATPTATTQTLQFPTYTAQAATATNAPTTQRSGHSMVWDNQDNQLLVFGGSDNTGNLLNDLWSYNTGTGTWKQLIAPTPVSSSTCGTVPAPRANAAMIWDTLNQRILLYGGVGTNTRYLDDLWSYSPSTGNWTVLQCTGSTPGMRSSNAVWTGQQMLLLGGTNKSGLLADFWSYTPNSGWQKIYTSTPMGPRAFQAMAWDTHDSRLYVFGGVDSTGLQQGDFWSYTNADGWHTLSPATNAATTPPARQQGLMAWDSTHYMLLFMGGWQDGANAPFHSIWAYDPVQNAWGLLNLVDSNKNPIIPGRTASSMAWDATHQRAYIYAGAGNDKSHSTLNDLWAIS